MAIEIERKFLVRELPELSGLEGTAMVQGYLWADGRGSVRVRITGAGARLTVKGPTRGHSRLEFEYEIPAEEAREMLDALTSGALVEKVRYRIEHGGHVWELDVFSGENDGLVVAEVELGAEDEQPALPGWVGPEVSGDPRFYNSSLSRHPFSRWPESPESLLRDADRSPR